MFYNNIAMFTISIIYLISLGTGAFAATRYPKKRPLDENPIYPTTRIRKHLNNMFWDQYVEHQDVNYNWQGLGQTWDLVGSLVVPPDPFCRSKSLFHVRLAVRYLQNKVRKNVEPEELRNRFDQDFADKVKYCGWAEFTRRALRMPWVEHGVSLDGNMNCKRNVLSIWKTPERIEEDEKKEKEDVKRKGKGKKEKKKDEIKNPNERDVQLFRVDVTPLPCAGSLILCSRSPINSFEKANHGDDCKKMFFLAPVGYRRGPESIGDFKVIGHSEILVNDTVPETYGIRGHTNEHEPVEMSLFKWEMDKYMEDRIKRYNSPPRTAAEAGYVYDALLYEKSCESTQSGYSYTVDKIYVDVPQAWVIAKHQIHRLFFGPIVEDVDWSEPTAPQNKKPMRTVPQEGQQPMEGKPQEGKEPVPLSPQDQKKEYIKRVAIPVLQKIDKTTKYYERQQQATHP